MKTKALLLAFATTALALGAKAQTATTFGVRAGVNFQNVNGKDGSGNDLDNNKIKTGFNIGVNAEVPIAPDFYVQPGVLFTTKGNKSKLDNDIKVNLSYIEVPVNLLYKPVLGTGKLLLGIGPYIAFAVGGSVTDANDKKSDIEFKSKISASQMQPLTAYCKRVDAGGNLLFGYEFSNKFSAQLNAQLGMVKINTKVENPTDNAKYKNTGFGISLGYRF